MTKTEQAEMDELGLTPEQLKERQEKIAQMVQTTPASAEAPAKPPRAKRSDAGKKREPKAQPHPGALSIEQLAKLKILIYGRDTRRVEADAAEESAKIALARFEEADKSLESYLSELQGK